MKVWILFVFIVVQGASLIAAPSAKGVQDLQKVLAGEESHRVKLETQLKELMEEIQSVDLTGETFDTDIQRIQNRLQDVKGQMAENQVRIEFLNGLLNGIDRESEPLKKLPMILLDLSHRQVASAVQNNTESKLWLFELYLSIALKNFFEPSENLGEFVKHYLAYSTILDPKSPRAFGKSREYLSYVKEDEESRKPSHDLPELKELTAPDSP